MKLHLPKMLAAAVLAAIASVGNLTCAAEPVDATFTTTNSVTTSVNSFWANGFTCVLTGARLTTTSEPTGVPISGCETVTLQSITSNIRSSAAGGTGLALISSTGEVLSLATNSASAAGDFTWTFTDATVATGSAIYFAYYDAANTNVAVGYTLQTGAGGDLFKAGAGTLRNYGGTSDYATCAFLGNNNVQDLTPQNSQYAPYLVITTTGSATPLDQYNWNGTGTTAAWDITSKNWLVGGTAGNYVNSTDGIVNFGDGTVAKEVTVNEAIEAGTVNVSDNYTFKVGTSGNLVMKSVVADGYTVTMDGEGTISLGTVRGTLAISSGTTVAMSTMPDLAAVTMEDGATLDLSSFSADIGNIKSIASGVTGDKTVRISANGERSFANGQTTNLLTNLEFIASAEFNGSGWAGTGHILNVGDGSQAASIKVAQDLRLESKLTLNIASGSSTVVGGELILGHRQTGNPGIVNVNGGTLTVGHIRPWDASTSNTVSLYDGTLEITQSGEVFTGDGATSTVTTFASSGASTVKNLSGGDITWNHAATVDGTLTLDTGAQNATFAGALEGAGTLDKAGAGTLVLEIPVLPPASTGDPIPTNAVTTVGVTVSEGTLRLGTAELEIPTITVGAGATLDATGAVSTKTAVTLGAGSTLAVGESGLVLLDDSSLNLPGTGTFKFQYGGTVGSQVVIATGLSIDHISGVTFTQDASTGEWYADASCVTVDAPLQALNQLRLLGTGDLVLTKATGGGSYWGAGIGSGPWDLSTENWATGDGASASGPFTNASAAHFTAAGSGGEISVGTGIDVTTIYVSGAAYNFTGGQNLTITNGISVTDSGSAAFDQVAGELKNVYIAGTASKLTIKNGDVIVNALSNEGTFIVDFGDSLTVKNATAMGGNVTARNLILTGENTFGSVKVSDTVSGATSIKLGGESRITKLSGVNKLTLTDGKLSLGSTITELKETTLSGALTAGDGVGLGSLTMNDGSSITGYGVLSASGITVSGTANILGTSTMLQTASVGGTGTLRVASGSTVGGSNLSVANNATLELLEGSTLANSGTLSVAGKVIAGNGVSLGTVDAKGTIELDGAAVSATGGSIAALDMGSGETLTVANNLALTSTTGGNGGSLNVDGALTVGGAATIGNVTAGTLELTTAGTLTASGTLDAGTITLDRVSKTDHYLTAGGLSESTTAFVVDKALIEALNVSAGQIITLANLNTVHDGAANLTINGAKYITDTHDLGYHIAQDSVTKDIILIARNQESNYVWVGSANENWSDAANWSGGMVPDETSWVQFNGGEQSILLDTPEPVQTRRLTVSAGTHDTIYGDQNLLLSQSLEVDGNASLNVGDGSTETMVSAPEVQVTGELNVQANAFVDAGHTTIKGGVLNVADGGSYFTGVVDMTEGGSLYTEGEASIAAEQLNGDSDSTVGGNVTIYGNGGRYSGGYDGAHINVVPDASATLYAGEGLTLHGDGTAKLLYTGNTAIDGVDADGLDIVLNDTTASSIGSTLTLEKASRMAGGSISFGMSAVDSAVTIGSNRIPVILKAKDFAVGDETTVVVSQDRIKDTGIAMAVWNDDYTQDLVLARVGADNTDTKSVVLDGYLYNKYYKNARIEHGNLTVDMRDDFYTATSGAHTPAGISGAGMLDNAFVELNPQISNPNGDLATVMTALEYGTIPAEKVDSVLAAMSGTSHAAMGTAWSHDVDRQLRAIRNRTTSMGVGECVVNEDMPFVNAWINAEGDYSKFNNDGTLAGYKLSSWGGTFGVDVDCTNRFTMGLAVTAMNGDFTALGDDNAEGDLDRMYVSVFGRYTRGSWTHTLVATIGMADTNLKRTVDYGTGSYATESSSDGTAYGVMYEAGYAIALNESASTCLQPVFNVSYRHSSLDGFTEKGDTDAALRGGDAASDVVSIALGARLQSIIGTSVYNRSSIFEGRVLFKFDAGDRDTAMHSSFMDVRRVQDVRSAEMGCFGLELGAGIVVPVAEDGGSLFFDVTAELRDKYTEVNGTAGYRYNF